MSMALSGRRGRGARLGLAWNRLRRIRLGSLRRGRGRRPFGILPGCLRRRRGGRLGLHALLAIVYVLALGTLAARVAAQIFITALPDAITVLEHAADLQPEDDHQVSALVLLSLQHVQG